MPASSKSVELLRGVPLLTVNALEPFIKYFDMEDLKEVCINKPKEVWLESASGWEILQDEELHIDALIAFAERLASHSGQLFNSKTPMLATHIPGYGFRVQVIGNMSDSGIGISIRVGAAKLFCLESYMPKAESKKVIDAVTSKKNILVCGGTSTGKTTMTNNLITHIPKPERIITVEDVRELIVPHPNHLALLKSKTGTDAAKITYEDIINGLTRLRPDRIIAGELTTDNTLPFLRLINTGHAGCIATLHADSPEMAFEAISQNMALTGKTTTDAATTIRYAKRAIDVVIQMKRDAKSKITAEYYEVK